MRRTFTITSASMPSLLGMPALEFHALDGMESLSSLYRYQLLLTTPDHSGVSEFLAANVPYKTLVGKEMTVHIQLDGVGSFMAAGVGAGERQISGLVTRARFVRSENRRAIYEVVIEPWLTLAERTTDYKIFQNLGVDQIVREVLSDYPYPSDLRLVQGYPKRDYEVQYGETDLAFISRLMEEWGLYYYFEHEGDVHRLVVVDDMASHKTSASAAYQLISYFPPGHKIDEEYCEEFTRAESLQSGQWVSNDFDFKKPLAQLQTRSALPRKTGHNDLELYDWPGDYVQLPEGKARTQVRMEEAGAPGSRANGRGHLRGIATGQTFQLQGCPQQDDDDEYLVLATTLSLRELGPSSGQGDYFCDCRFELQPTTKIYRPPQRHPKPRTSGPQTAIITGPKGREIYTDEYGRVKLSFHWNRYCTKDENSSCWVRVSQPWAGTNFGGVAIPRIGQEVIVDFENGDPDKPIVTGRVYNAMNMPPWSLPANMTQSGILTRSSEGAGPANANALRFEDKTGQEEVWLHAEKDQRIEVEHDESHWIGNDRRKNVDNNETTTIGNARTETVGGTHTETIKLQRTLSVTDAGCTETIRDDLATTSLQGCIALTANEQSILLTAAVSIVLKVGASSITITDGNIVVDGPTQVDINP